MIFSPMIETLIIVQTFLEYRLKVLDVFPVYYMFFNKLNSIKKKLKRDRETESETDRQRNRQTDIEKELLILR